MVNRIGSVVVLILLAGGSTARAAEAKPEQQEQEKARVLREAAQNWISVGAAQYKRGFFAEAEKSFTIASGYQEYLTVPEQKGLNVFFEKAHKAGLEREIVMGHIRMARDLVRQGQPIKARAHFEKVRNSEYLTEQERKQIGEELKNIDGHFDKQKAEIMALYNRSVEYYRAGELEKARDGFLEVAKYGLLVTSKGQSAEDYLIEIDSVLTERLRKSLPAEAPPVPELPVPDIKKPQEDVCDVMQGEPNAGPGEEIAAVAEPAPPQETTEQSDQENRANVIRGYAAAVVSDAETKVDRYIEQGDISKAIESIRNASVVLRENRAYLGEELFGRYIGQLKQLADKIVKAQDGQRQ
jgi:tetratricopeptide (TPR) repeat protein